MEEEEEALAGGGDVNHNVKSMTNAICTTTTLSTKHPEG